MNQCPLISVGKEKVRKNTAYKRAVCWRNIELFWCPKRIISLIWKYVIKFEIFILVNHVMKYYKIVFEQHTLC